MRAPHDGNRDGQEVGQSQPHGRPQALDMLVPGLGGLSTWRGRGRGLFPPTPAIPQTCLPRPVWPVAPFTPLGMPPQPMGKRQRLPSSIPINTPSTHRRFHTPCEVLWGPSQTTPNHAPLFMSPWSFSNCAPYTVQDPNDPPYYDDLFLPQHATFNILQWQQISCPYHHYIPPPVCSMTLLPLHPTYLNTVRVLRLWCAPHRSCRLWCWWGLGLKFQPQTPTHHILLIFILYKIPAETLIKNVELFVGLKIVVTPENECWGRICWCHRDGKHHWNVSTNFTNFIFLYFVSLLC